MILFFPKNLQLFCVVHEEGGGGAGTGWCWRSLGCRPSLRLVATVGPRTLQTARDALRRSPCSIASITVADVGGFSATTVPSNARFCVARVKLLYASASLAKKSKRRPGLNSGMAKTRTLKVRSFFFPFTTLLQFLQTNLLSLCWIDSQSEN